MSNQEKDFLDIRDMPHLYNFLKTYYFSNITDKDLQNCIELYTANLTNLKKLYQKEFPKKATIGMTVAKIKHALQTKEKYKGCDDTTFDKLCLTTVRENIPPHYLLQWLEKNGGYKNSELSPDVLVEEFFNRLTAKTYYRPVSLEKDICGLDLTQFREEIVTRHKGIYANVLSASKIAEGGLELLDSVVYCISKNFGMPKLKTDENGTVTLAELQKPKHSIVETLTVDEDEKLVFFNWNKTIILCEGFHIKEISPGESAINFATMPAGLYNYILVCFATESEKKYKLYMAEAQPLEIGSKHWNIMAKVNQDLQEEQKEGNPDTSLVIITAGEIELTSEKLLFNFFSGTIFTKILQGECEVITGLNYDENTDERCHSVIYDYFLVPYMMSIFQRCNVNEAFSFSYTSDHLIDPAKLRDKGIIFDLAYYEKLKVLSQNKLCEINFDKPE